MYCHAHSPMATSVMLRTQASPTHWTFTDSASSFQAIRLAPRAETFAYLGETYCVVKRPLGFIWSELSSTHA